MTKELEVIDIKKHFDGGLITALRGVTFSVNQGQIVAFMGRSGCGKSTLLNVIGTLDTPSSGQVLYRGKSTSELGPLHRFRQTRIGFVFQHHHLLPTLTLQENLEAAIRLRRDVPLSVQRRKVDYLLDLFEIGHRAKSFASTISGGERQRGAIARALVNSPGLILADEPTGNVDSGTAKSIMSILKKHVEETNAILLIATHDPSIAEEANNTLTLQDGILVT